MWLTFGLLAIGGGFLWFQSRKKPDKPQKKDPGNATNINVEIE
jgi:hypothetical protein